MHVATAQLPAIEDSDDKIFTTPNAVIMLDGASAFVPVPVPASIYADELGRCLRQTLTEQPDGKTTAMLAQAIETTASRLNLSPGESPSSTVTIVRELVDEIEVLVLGDNLIVTPEQTFTDDRMDKLDLDPRRKYQERLAAGFGYDDEHRALLHELQTQQARQRNRPGGYWIAEASPEAAEHAFVSRRARSRMPWAALATDGAYNTMTYLGTNHWASLAKKSDSQLQAELEHAQTWESDNDPHGQHLPRAKRHDDKSLATIRFCD